MSDRSFKDILDFSSGHNLLVRYPDSADFKSVVRGAAQNEVWRDTTSETLWDILSSCGKDINNIVSSSAIDYVQNLADLNTARIPALASMAGMLKYEIGSLMEIYGIFPAGLQLMLDVLSIDREYLFGGDSPILSVPLVRKLMEKMKVGLMKSVGRNYEESMALEDVFTEIKLNGHRVDEDTYRSMIKEIYYEMILDVLGATYSATDGTALVDNLLYSELDGYERLDDVPRKTILDRMIQGESRHPLDVEETVGSSITLDSSIQINPQENYSSLAGQIEALRRTYNVSKSFNPWVVADQINEHGFSPNNELTDNEKILVETILNAHNKERFDYSAGHYLLGKIDTRYGYYREAEFVKYLRAFLVLHALKVQAVNLNVTTLNLVGITVVESRNTGVLDLFTYVNKAWEYEQDEAADTEPVVDRYGIGRPSVRKPIGTVSEKHFIPRVLGGMSSVAIETSGYDYIEEYGTLGSRSIALEDTKSKDILEIVAEKLTELTFKIHAMRNEMKRQAQFNAMRGTGSLLAHAINDFLLTKYPTEQFDVIPRWSDERSYSDRMKELAESGDINALAELQARIEENIKLFRNYTNVDIIEYMDTTEYFNIHPTGLYTNDEVLLSTRYWEQLSKAITDRDKAQLGVFSPNEIREFYRNRMSVGSLHSTTEVEDDIEEFLLSLYETGATDASYNAETGEIVHPINDIANEDSLFAYESKRDRMKVQNNEELVEKQNAQFLRYSSDTSLVGNDRNRNGNGQVIEALNWKNTKYASVMLHPFMYTFQLWNPLVNIIINAMSEYITSDLERNLTNKRIFDDLYGVNGEGRNFWKYNVLDFTGYVTRYEHEKHDKVDAVGEVSELTGYDGLFYPTAVQEFIEAYERTAWEIEQTIGLESGDEKYAGYKGRFVYDFTPRLPLNDGENIGRSIFISEAVSNDNKKSAYLNMTYSGDDDYGHKYGAPKSGETFEQVIASIYWQLEFKSDINRITDIDTASSMTYYGKWFAHLGYSDERCKRIAKQLWYWRERIVDAATHRYAVCNYNLDLGNNSMFLMDTFADELPDDGEERFMPAIDALDASLSATNNFIERAVNSNHNTTAGRCFTPVARPKELWIRWNAEPIAMPAFDVYWNNERLRERWYDESMPHDNRTSLGAAGRFQEFGQIKYKDSSTNDAINDAIENFSKIYELDGSGSSIRAGNKAPIFYSFQQNADVLVFSSWRRISDNNSLLDGYDRTSLCPVHILCRETQASDGTYSFERFLQDTPSIDPIGKTQSDSHLSSPYIFDSSGGNIIIPTYRISTPRPTEFADDPSNPENRLVMEGQSVFIKLYALSCQSVVKSNYETQEKLTIYNEKRISINADNLFSGTVLISNGTAVLFSLDGEKLGMAFLGNFTRTSQDVVSRTLASSCTRYLADSDPQERIALLRKKFYLVKGERDEEADKDIGTYADIRISDDERNIWNSFDRNDKFVCVVQYDGALMGGSWELEAKNSTKFSSRILNLVSDASYIPEFAYQSPKDFERFPEVSGTTKLFDATYFALRDHWAVQLLGLENNLMLDFVKVAQNLVVRDETNNVDTYVNPGQVVDAIYRIWEQSEMTDKNMGIERLYNPKLIFDSETGVATWTETWVVNDEGKDEFLDRHISIVRCNENKEGEILNEKNWVLKTMRIGDFVDDVSKQNESGDGFRRVSLDDFYTVALENNGHSCKSTSHILVGTQDPYKYSTDPDWATTLRSPAYLLQYGNGVAGARRCEVGVFIEKRPADEVVPEGCPSRDDAPYRVSIVVKLFKFDKEVHDRMPEEINTYMNETDVIPSKCLLMAVSEDEVDRLMDYHMLVHHEDIFYNIPNPDEDDALRTKYDERIDDKDNPPPHGPPKSFLDYLYVYEGSTAFKINEQSDKFCTFQWERPNAELDKLLYNFRKNQVDLNCLYPWSTYVTQEHNPAIPSLTSVEMETVNGTDCRGVEEFRDDIPQVGNLVVDIRDNHQANIDVAFWIDGSGSLGTMVESLKRGLSMLIDDILANNPNIRIAFVKTSAGCYVTDDCATIVHDFSSNRDEIMAAISSIPSGNGSEVGWGIQSLLSNENMLSWRKDAYKAVVAISDETDEIYTSMTGSLWTSTLNGEPVPTEEALESDEVEWVREPTTLGDSTAKNADGTYKYPGCKKCKGNFDWGRMRPNDNPTRYWDVWDNGFNPEKHNAEEFAKVFNEHNAMFIFLGCTNVNSIRDQRKKIDWYLTYMLQMQRDVVNKIKRGGFARYYNPGSDASIKNILSDVFRKVAIPPPIWEYEIQPGDSTNDILKHLIDAGYMIHTWEDESSYDAGGGSVKTIDVSGDDFDSIYKIYANYQKVDDSDDPRGYHFDLFFNIQNLFKPPFEYISDVTNQPAPHLLPDSWLYLPGDKNSRLEAKGGRLTLYAQMKWLINDITSAVKTIPLVTYEIYNISDDKPKFFLKKIGEMENIRPSLPTVFIRFEDVYIDGSQLIDGVRLVDDRGIVNKEFDVIQAVSVHYNNDVHSEYNRLNKLKFTIVQNNAVQIGSTVNPPYVDIDKTKKFFRLSDGGAGLELYPRRFNDRYSSMGTEKYGYSVSYNYPDSSYTNEDLYLYWTIPQGVDVVQAIQKLGCLVEDTALRCSAKMKSGDDARVVVIPGHIYITSIMGTKEYLGVEHGRMLNKFGYVLTKASNKIRLK